MTISNPFCCVRSCATLAVPICLGVTPLFAHADADSHAQAQARAESRIGGDPRLPADAFAPAAGHEPAGALSAQAADRSPAVDGTSLWSGAPTVATLLQLDAQAALLAERKRIDRLLAIVRPSGSSRATAGGIPSLSHDVQHDAVVLNAIYGVGGALTADLTVDGARQRLRVRSRNKAVDDEDKGDGIVRIDHVRQCVVLRQAGVERSACLTPTGALSARDATRAAPADVRTVSDAAGTSDMARLERARATPMLRAVGGAQ